MKRLLFCFALLAGAATLHAQDTIPTDSVVRFHRIDVSGNLDVVLRQDSTYRLSSGLDGGEASRLSFAVKSGVLTVRLRAGGERTRVEIGCGRLDGIAISGARVETADTLRGEQFDFELSGGGRLTAAVRGRDIYVRATADSSVELKGATDYLIVEGAMRSKLDCRELCAESVDATAYSTAELYVCALERLYAGARGAGSIFYRGNPELLRVKSSMGGNINDIGD